MHLLPVSLAPIADICTKDGAPRFGATTGVQITVNEDGTYLAESTDGRLLLRVTGSTVGTAEEFPPIPALASAPNGEASAIVPAKDWKKSFGDAKKLTARGCNKVADLENGADIDAHRITQAWRKIEDLKRINSLLRTNFDNLLKTMKQL